MICSKCGKVIKDEAQFCNFCGTKIVVVNDNKILPSTFSKKNCPIKNWIIGAVIFLLLCAIITVVILFTGNQRNVEIVTQRFDKYFYLGNSYLVTENDEYEIHVDSTQIADDGTIAYINDLGKLDVIKGSDTLHSDLNVESFILSKDGSTIALSSNGNDSYYWKLSDNTCKLISNEYSPQLISDNGKTISLGGYYSVDGGKPKLGFFGYIFAISPDGKLVYYNIYCTSTTDNDESNETRKETSAIGVVDTKTENSKEILKYTDPNYSGYLVAANYKADEIIFGFGDDFYYYSYINSNNSAKKITGLQSVEYIVSLENVCSRNGVTHDEFDETIHGWIYYKKFPYTHNIKSSNVILNNIYCLLNDDNTVSLAFLNDECHMELIADYISSNLAFSEDKSIIWCVSNEIVSYIDMTNDIPNLIQTSNLVGYYIENYYMLPYISTTSNGSLALFIGDDGYSYYINKEDMVPHKMVDHTAFSWISCDNDLYVLSNIDTNDYKGGDLYCLPYEKISSHEMSYQMTNVFDLKLTTNKTYIIVGNLETGELETYDIYEVKDYNYSLIANDINPFIYYSTAQN